MSQKDKFRWKTREPSLYFCSCIWETRYRISLLFSQKNFPQSSFTKKFNWHSFSHYKKYIKKRRALLFILLPPQMSFSLLYSFMTLFFHQP